MCCGGTVPTSVVAEPGSMPEPQRFGLDVVDQRGPSAWGARSGRPVEPEVKTCATTCSSSIDGTSADRAAGRLRRQVLRIGRHPQPGLDLVVVADDVDVVVQLAQPVDQFGRVVGRQQADLAGEDGGAQARRRSGSGRRTGSARGGPAAGRRPPGALRPGRRRRARPLPPRQATTSSGPLRHGGVALHRASSHERPHAFEDRDMLEIRMQAQPHQVFDDEDARRSAAG